SVDIRASVRSACQQCADLVYTLGCFVADLDDSSRGPIVAPPYWCLRSPTIVYGDIAHRLRVIEKRPIARTDPSLPLVHQGDQFLAEVRVYLPIVQLILEIVAYIVHVHLPSIIDILIRRPRTCAAHPIVARPAVARPSP